jgi:hypothetical protein
MALIRVSDVLVELVEHGEMAVRFNGVVRVGI